MMDWSTGEQLSPQGARRRAEILGVLESAQRARRVQRIGVQLVGVALVLMLATITLRVWQNTVPTPAPHLPPIARTRPLPGPMIEVVGNVPGIVERVTVPDTEMPRAMPMGDDELAGVLASAGLSNGYVRSGDKFRLASDVAPPRVPGG